MNGPGPGGSRWWSLHYRFGVALVFFNGAIYPIGINFDLIAFQPEVVERKLAEFATNLVQAVVIVLVVMLLFLGLRTGLVVASLWFGGGPMYEPMAVAIIFGLLSATLLTFGIVPIFYSLFFRVSFKEFVC